MGFSNLAPNLRELRQARGFSQQALAFAAGPPFSQSYISRLERGLAPSDLAHIDVLASKLGVSARRLLQRPRHARPVTVSPLRDSRKAG
jgi:transcriptional regulator with XRE-family HTH domain